MKTGHLKKLEGYTKKIEALREKLMQYHEEIDEIHSIATDELEEKSESYQESDKGSADYVRLDNISEIVESISSLDDDMEYLIQAIYEATSPD